jgi:hypothetical protein
MLIRIRGMLIKKGTLIRRETLIKRGMLIRRGTLIGRTLIRRGKTFSSCCIIYNVCTLYFSLTTPALTVQNLLEESIYPRDLYLPNYITPELSQSSIGNENGHYTNVQPLDE